MMVDDRVGVIRRRRGNNRIMIGGFIVGMDSDERF